MSWRFSLRYSGDNGGTPFQRVDSRAVEADLVAKEDVNGEGALSIELGTVQWTYANADYEVKLTRSEKGEVKDKIRITALKDKVAPAEKAAQAKATELAKHVGKGYFFPVKRTPFVVGGGWSAGDVINSLFDWMMVHDDLGKDGRAAGTSWEQDPDIKDTCGGSASFPFAPKKIKFTASASGTGVRVTGSRSITVSDPRSSFGAVSAKHTCTKEWSFVDDAFAGGKRTISAGYSRASKEKMFCDSSSFSVQETLTIKRK